MSNFYCQDNKERQSLAEVLREAERNGIDSVKLPINEIIEDSLFYPGSGYDSGDIRICNSQVKALAGIISFIHCDYSIGRQDFLAGFRVPEGYGIMAGRDVRFEEMSSEFLSTKEFPSRPPREVMSNYASMRIHSTKPYVLWLILKKKDGPEGKGRPEFLSLLHVCGEGVATFQTFYWSFKRAPKVLAIIQPGTPADTNWTDFHKEGQALSWVTYNNPAGTPGYIFYGGEENDYNSLDWKGFTLTDTINDYYSPSKGRLTVWRNSLSHNAKSVFAPVGGAEYYDPYLTKYYEKSFIDYYHSGYSRDFSTYFKVRYNGKGYDRVPMLLFADGNSPCRDNNPSSSYENDLYFSILTYFVSLYPQMLLPRFGRKCMLHFHRATAWPMMVGDDGELISPADVLKWSGLFPVKENAKTLFVTFFKNVAPVLRREVDEFLQGEELSIDEVAYGELKNEVAGNVKGYLDSCDKEAGDFLRTLSK